MFTAPTLPMMLKAASLADAGYLRARVTTDPRPANIGTGAGKREGWGG